MSDNKKYYYMKLKENFFSEDSIVILEGMPDGYLYSNILLKLYLKSIKNQGKLVLNEYIPYSPTMLAQLTGHNVGVMEKALQIFKQLGLIDVLDNGAIYMLDIQNFIGKSSTEADRIRAYRNRIASEKQPELPESTEAVQMYDKCTPETEKEIETDTEIEIETERDKKEKEEKETIDYQKIVDMYNDTCVSFPRLRTMSDSRKKAIKARIHSGYKYSDFEELFEKAEDSTFLKGGNDRNWMATFDWLIKDGNMAKVLEGNYDDKKKVISTANTESRALRMLREMGEIE